MTEMLKFDKPDEQAPIIKVIGVGGGGSNAVSYMYTQGIKGVDFYICNTDSQSLNKCEVPNKIRLGNTGLGAGANPTVGRDAAILIADEIREILSTNTSMLFITAGMGGGTGTGATPIIAQIAKELGILTVGIITKPFSFEGRKRELQATAGIEELKKYVDTTLVICNDKLLDMQGDMKLSQAFGKADNVLTIAAKGIAEIITVTGRINVDFEDVKTVMQGSGKAIMGSGIANGPDRAVKAVEMALNSPLLDDTDIKGAANVLLYITSGKNEISLEELNDITGYITSRTGEDANVIWGDGVDENLEDEI
jgi:cell division protein FtsZ